MSILNNLPTLPFINCPLCNSAMENRFNSVDSSVIYKHCRLRPNHKFGCVVFTYNSNSFYGERDELVRFIFSLEPSQNRYVGYDLFYDPPTMFLVNEYTFIAGFPDQSKLDFYIVPDFTNFPKTILTIKNYLSFI